MPTPPDRYQPAPTSAVRLHLLRSRPSDDDPDTVVVGRPDTGTFVELPAIALAAIRLLDAGCTVGEVEQRLERDHQELVDVVDLVTALADLGFVRDIGQPTHHHPTPPSHRHDEADQPDRPSQHRTTAGAVLWVALILAAVGAAVARPHALPHVRDYFWTPYVGIAFAVNTALWWLGAMLHELMHVAAARSVGVPARIRFGTRLYSLVAETDVTAAWLVPRRARYRIYLAGIIWDLALIAVITIAEAGWPNTVPGPFNALRLSLSISLAYQCAIYMRTDLYFVLLDLLRCRNLWGDATAYLRWRLRRARRVVSGALRRATDHPADPTPLRHLPAHEGRAVRIYTLVLAFGSTAAIAIWATVLIPLIATGAVRAVHEITALTGWRHTTDGILFLTTELTLQTVYLVAFVRSHPQWFRRGRERVTTRTTSESPT